MKSHIKPLVSFVFIIYFSTASAQENTIFHRFTTQDGLCFDRISNILQDKEGFLWIGTAEGLSRYDGSRFLNFTHAENDTTSISDNYVFSFACDKNGTMWLTTYFGGINKFNEASHTFSNIYPYNKHGNILEGSKLTSFTDDDHLLFADGNIKILNVKTNSIEQITVPENTWSKESSLHLPNKFQCSKILKSSNGKWWLSGEVGFVGYDPKTKEFDVVSLNKNIPKQFNLHQTWGCSEDKQHNIWVASGCGLFVLNIASRNLIQRYPTGFENVDVKSLFVKCVLCDDDGSVWFGTANGLFHYFPSTGKYFAYRNNPYNNSSISNNDINCLYKDRQNILWVGTDNGLNAVYPITSSFAYYSNMPGDVNSLQSNIAGGAFKDIDGNIWIGTEYGLECRDFKTGKYAVYSFDDPRIKNKDDYQVMPVFQNDSSSFWIGTWGCGLQLFDYRKRKFVASYVHDDDETTSISSNYVVSICKDESGNLWMATWNGGIEKLNLKEKKFTHFNSLSMQHFTPYDFIATICYSSKTLWAGCSSGMLKYNSNTERFELVAANMKDNKNVIGRIINGPDNSMWVGTVSGLFKYNPVENHFEKIAVIKNNTVSGIFQENNGRLWLGTTRGLIQYEPQTKKAITYTIKDGIPARNFPGHCYFEQSGDGEIFVNTTNGLIHFYPDRILANKEAPSLYITSVKIKNKELNTYSFPDLRPVNLKYDQNYISIDFAALNFINPAANNYAYQLSGIDKDWVYSNNHNEAVYTNLLPGDYVFKVKASNDADVWNNNGISLLIHISSPWWQTWWFYTLCIVAIAVVLYSLYYIRVKRLKEMYLMRSNIARDLHDEIGSTLTSINILSKISGQHIENDMPKAKTMINEINDQSLEMQQSMSDIVWAINPENDKLENMLIRMREYISKTLEPKNINAIFSANEATINESLTMQQRRDFFLIFKEAINNAAKYALCNNVEIILARQNGTLELLIKDDGIGFDATETTSSNGLKNMKSRAEALNGKIIITSANGKGTSINLKIPFNGNNF
jgi:ligand-binding sensor domain-containing protein/two-component sensor histidine kinase